MTKTQFQAKLNKEIQLLQEMGLSKEQAAFIIAKALKKL